MPEPSNPHICFTASARFFVFASRKGGLLLLVASPLVGCERLWPSGSSPDAGAASVAVGASASPQVLTSSPAPTAKPTVSEPSAPPDAGVDAGLAQNHPGPWLTVTQSSAAVYAQPSNDKDSKLGYVQSGAKLAVTGKGRPGDGCASGWLQLVEGGFVCGAIGTLDDKDPKAHFAMRPPDLDALLPYTYARNVKNGTPMYRTVPTRDEMKRYEPYLDEENSDSKSQSKNGGQPSPSAVTSAADVAPVPPAVPSSGTNAASPPPVASTGGSPPPNSAGDEAALPWWQREDSQDKLHEMKLSDLRSDSDDVLAQRMVKGFYVAVDRTFRWNGRTWYKTTKHMVVPADRFGVAGASEFQGVELGTSWELPVAWAYGGTEGATLYEIDAQKKQPRVAGKLKHFEAIQATTETLEINSNTYIGLRNGKWVRQSQVRVTAPGPAPEGLKPNERWVDVSLAQQTLVAYEGTTPVFATLLSSGKSSRIKDKDHSTPIGRWRIREKHITTTMDGDGTAAGDRPYSIEDVPYTMYFFRAYAIHGAFWHRNYGVQMSHGCINLSPLDAKRLFFFTAPQIPTGWHGVWSSSAQPGSWVVVHE